MILVFHVPSTFLPRTFRIFDFYAFCKSLFIYEFPSHGFSPESVLFISVLCLYIFLVFLLFIFVFLHRLMHIHISDLFLQF